MNEALETKARKITAEFADALWRNRSGQVRQMLRADWLPEHPSGEDWFASDGPAYKWLQIARAGFGLVDESQRLYIGVALAKMADWLFAVPGHPIAEIPPWWAETPMGRLWHAAFVWAHADELITVSQAADLLDVSLNGIGSYISRGQITAYINEKSRNPVRGRRLLLRSDVEALRRDTLSSL